MTEYDWKSEITKLLRILRASKKVKEKNRWSKNIGAGFIMTDIEGVKLHEDKSFTLAFCGLKQELKAKELNLKETNELILYLETKKFRKEMYRKIKAC